MRLKDGVRISSLTVPVLLSVITAQEEYQKYETELVITSGEDSRHSSTSLHYSGNAVDLRTRTLPNPKVDGQQIANTLDEKLGRNFDVIFEGDHIHIEYQPRRPL